VMRNFERNLWAFCRPEASGLAVMGSALQGLMLAYTFHPEWRRLEALCFEHWPSKALPHRVCAQIVTGSESGASAAQAPAFRWLLGELPTPI
jgi:hypothetical protein